MVSRKGNEMIRYVWITLMAVLFGVGGLVTADAADPSTIRAAMVALEQAPTHAEKFQALAQAAATSDATPEQARALAVCILGYHLYGQADNAAKAKALLEKNHGDAYQDVVSNERLFEKHTCPDCNGEGTLSVPCPDCRDGKCSNCNGTGDRPGLTSRLTCTVCRGTGRCKTCNGTGELTRTCPRCRGTGGALEFKRDAVTETYLSLLREGGVDDAEVVAAAPSDARQPIILNVSQVEQFNEEYKGATSLKRPAIYQAFLKQIGADKKGSTPIFLPVENGILFIVQDVGSLSRNDTTHYFASLLDDSGKRRYRLMLGTDRTFAENLQKGSPLTSVGWLSPLSGRPPWRASMLGSREVYRSASEYMSIR